MSEFNELPESLKEAVAKQFAASLQGKMEQMAHKSPKVQSPEIEYPHPHDATQPEEIDGLDGNMQSLDTDETLRMENLLLRQQIEHMTQQLEEFRKLKVRRELDDAKKGFQRYLHKKHNISEDVYRIVLDAEKHTLTVVKR